MVCGHDNCVKEVIVGKHSRPFYYLLFIDTVCRDCQFTTIILLLQSIEVFKIPVLPFPDSHLGIKRIRYFHLYYFF